MEVWDCYFVSIVPFRSFPHQVLSSCVALTETNQLRIFYSAIALFSIIATASICLFSYREAHGMSKSFFELMLYGFINLPKYIGAFIVAFLYYIPVIFFRCLPISVKSKVRLVRRYGVKAGQGLEEKGEMQMHALKRKIERKGETDKYTAKELGEPTNLGEFLSIYDVLIEVVQHLHYVDVVNLGLVSKSVREAVLPADEYEQRMTHFKMYACHNKGKKQCWVCNNQICRSTVSHAPLFPPIPDPVHYQSGPSFYSNAHSAVNTPVPSNRLPSTSISTTAAPTAHRATFLPSIAPPHPHPPSLQPRETDTWIPVSAAARLSPPHQTSSNAISTLPPTILHGKRNCPIFRGPFVGSVMCLRIRGCSRGGRHGQSGN